MFSPAAERNKAPILAALQRHVSPGQTVLEIASGSLQHACYLAPRLEVARWVPSEINPAALRHDLTIRARPAAVTSMIELDVRALPWPIADPVDVVFTANLLHISEESVVERLFEGAKDVLVDAGQLIVYGPFKVGDAHTSEGNRRFDASLRSENAAWGIRDLEAVCAAAARQGFEHRTTDPMPANNFLVRFAFC